MSGPALLWRGGEPLLLASTSRTRRRLLEDAGLPVEAEAAGVDERAVEAGLGRAGADALARELSVAKALAVSRRRPGRIVVGADQTLALEGGLLHRPPDVVAAKAQLAELAGKTHRLYSAVAVARSGEIVDGFVEAAALAMRSLSAAAIEAYAAVAGQERLTQSVGAYQLEGVGVHLFEAIEGEHSTILGLPLLPLLRSLRRLQLLAF